MDKLNQKTKNVIWNMIFSLLNAGQSVLLLFFVNHLLGESSSGIFSYGFSVAVLFMYVGNYGIRNFQVSDTQEKYSFREYYLFRWITVTVMLAVSTLYAFFTTEDLTKKFTLIALCVFRAGECMEDVFQGRYQQKGDLALAGIVGTIRYLVADVAFLLALLFSRNLVISACLYAFITVLMVFFLNRKRIADYTDMKEVTPKDHDLKDHDLKDYDLKVQDLKDHDLKAHNLEDRDQKKSNYISGLLLECFPLFFGYFLTTYLTNIGKYAIDRYGDNILQAYFNMLFMPVLLINLLSTMIFRPIIVDMANLFSKKKKAEYYKLVYRQILYILGISIIVLPLCYFIGIPFLSWFYGSSLLDYKKEFMLLMTGGVFSAVISYLNVCIITIRGQKTELIVTLVIAVIATALTYPMVRTSSLYGASVSYLVIMILLSIAYLLIHEIISRKYFARVSLDTGENK